MDKEIIFKSDEIDVGIRKSDCSRWVRFYVGEYNKQEISDLFLEIGNSNLYDVKIQIERH